MSKEEISFYTKIILKKLEKKPILRVQQKKLKKLYTSNSTKNINRKYYGFESPLYLNTQKYQNRLKNEKKIINRNPIKKYNSITYFNRDEKNRIKKKDDNKKEKLLYCLNCCNKKLNLERNLTKFLKPNNSYDYSLNENISLKKLDEDYISQKIIQSERRQIAAYNHLQKYKNKNPKTKSEKLQYINENQEYPFLGLNLQDYLYYNNKKKNEKRNKLILNNISSFDFSQPRKGIKDYYNKVMFQTPILEKDSRPSIEYKLKYIETLKEQIRENKINKKNKKKEENIKEMNELNKYNEMLFKYNEEENIKKKIRQNLINENNINIINYKKKSNEMNNKENINGYKNKIKKFKEKQNLYVNFINQQRINEINNLQNWINENLKQKKEQLNLKQNEDKKWRNYHKKFNESFNDNIKVEKCAECNLIFNNRLQKFHKS